MESEIIPRLWSLRFDFPSKGRVKKKSLPLTVEHLSEEVDERCYRREGGCGWVMNGPLHQVP